MRQASATLSSVEYTFPEPARVRAAGTVLMSRLGTKMEDGHRSMGSATVEILLAEQYQICSPAYSLKRPARILHTVKSGTLAQPGRFYLYVDK